MSETTNNNFKAPKQLDLILDTNYPPIEWLVDGLIPTESIVLMSAKPKSLKTWLMCEMSIKIASGETMMNRFPTKQSGVLILDEESSERQLYRNFTVLNAQRGLPIKVISFANRKIDQEYTTWLIDYCKLNGIEMVVFDSLRRFHIAEENSSGEMSQVFELFSQFKNAGITCLIIAHDRKNNGHGDAGDAIRGSSDILAACDVHIAISRRSNVITP